MKQFHTLSWYPVAIPTSSGPKPGQRIKWPLPSPKALGAANFNQRLASPGVSLSTIRSPAALSFSSYTHVQSTVTLVAGKLNGLWNTECKFLPHFVASLEDPNCPVGKFIFLLLAALIERNGSIVCRFVLPVIEGNGPHTQKHSEHDVRPLFHAVYDTLNTPNVVNSNLILSNSSFCGFKYLLTLLFHFSGFFRVSFLLSLFTLKTSVPLEMHLNEAPVCL
jgi:hypothetical protein